MKTIFWFILLLIPINSIAQFNPGAKQTALSNSDAAMSNDVFALFNNPAGIASLAEREFGAFYSPSPFGLKELANGYICFNQPFTFGSFALGLSTYGFELYKENKITLCFSKKFFNDYLAGISVNYLNVSIKNYGSSGTLIFNAGFLCPVDKDLYWGVYINNFTRASIGSDNDQLPVVLNTGFCFMPIDKLYLNAAVEKDIDYNPSLRFGVEYTIIDLLSLRSGFSTEPDSFSAGVGINYSRFNLDYAIISHPDLGFTHQFGIIINIDK
jgi:hypothetical protein